MSDPYKGHTRSRAELGLRPSAAAFVVGDLNCDVQKLVEAQALLDQGWQDLGAVASNWRGPDCQPTCYAPTCPAGTRRDFVLASPAGVSLVRDFRVLDQMDYATHRTI